MKKERRATAKQRVSEEKNTAILRDAAVRARAYIRLCPKDPSEQNKLGEEMVHHVLNNEIYALEEFPISLNMAPSWFYRMSENNEHFANCLNLARYIIATRLQNEWRTRKIDKEFALRMLPIYHDEYKEFTLSKIMKDSQGKEMARLTVVIPNLEATQESLEDKKES